MHTHYGWPQISYCKYTLNPAKTNAIPLTENATKMWWNTVKLHIFKYQSTAAYFTKPYETCNNPD